MSPAARGRRVLARLDALGLSVRWLGEQIGESEPQMHKMLKESSYAKKGGIGPEEAWLIARAIQLTANYILFGNREGLPADVLRSLPPED